MSTEIFTEWLKRQGYRIYQTESSCWFNQGPRALQAYPYNRTISPSQAEIDNLLKTSHSVTLRYSTPITAPEGKISYQVIFDGDDFSIETFPRKIRHMVGKGLKHCDYRPISLSRMIEQGWNCREETLVRQGRTGAESKQWWERLCAATEGLPGFEMWGAVRNDQLLSSILVFNDGETANILFQQSLTDHLKFGINNTLTYAFVNHTIQNKEATIFFYGLHSLDAPASVDIFKFRMGFKARPILQKVAFNPNVSWMVNDFSYKGVAALRSRVPNFSILAKAEGMIRFYLEGKKPLAEQKWPEGLIDEKESILNEITQIRSVDSLNENI